MEKTSHFRQMLVEKNIREDWVERTLSNPERVEEHEDGTRHFLKQIPEFGGRWLRIVVSFGTKPEQAVTAFFDRRLRGTK
ncbi:MAG: DUF4258 domain-containing protein [Deltaproteobacteria bacterium]|nr:DUF4258 domain-containing protein [Deltaproteobacteria bacterium]